MICPKCKTQNVEQANLCHKCGFKLKLACPFCTHMNNIGQIECSSCKKKTLQVCPECNALNTLKSQNCRKCSALLETVPKQETEQFVLPDISLDNYAVVVAELFNYSAIKSKIPDSEMLNKILSKFYQIYAKQAKLYSQKAKKIKENIMLIEFKYSSSLRESVFASLNASLDSSYEIKEFNRLILSKFNIEFKVKMGLYIANKDDTKYSDEERLAARAEDIIVASELAEKAGDIFVFDIVKASGGEEFYRLIDRRTPERNEDKFLEVPREEPEQQPSAYKMYSRIEVFESLSSKIKDTNDAQVVTVVGSDGLGKSSLLAHLRESFKDNQLVWLIGQCCQCHNLVPFAFLHNLLKSFFGLPAQNINVEESKKQVLSLFRDKMGINNQEMQDHLLRLIFPESSSSEDGIYFNKEKTFQVVQSLLFKICQEYKVIFIIEDMEYIDLGSLELIRRLMAQGLLNQNIKIFITTKMEAGINAFFNLDVLNENNTQNMHLSSLSASEINNSISGMINDKDLLPLSIRDQMVRNSKGLPVYIEEALLLLMQTGGIVINPEKQGEFLVDPEVSKIKLPIKTEDIINIRLNNIAQISPNAFKVVYYASVLGFKFLPILVKNILEIPDDEFNDIMSILIANGIFQGFDKFNFVFKNTSIWQAAYNIELSTEIQNACFMSINQGLLQNTLTHSAILAENSIKINLTPKYILNYLEQAAYEAYTAGDEYSYTELKKLMLKYIDGADIENKEEIKTSIFEDLGKLNYLRQPRESIEYLFSLVKMYEEKENPAKVIELSGFLSKSCEITGDFASAVECIDKSITNIDKNQRPFEHAFLHYAKIEFLFNLGRVEELVVIARTVVLPAIEAVKASKSSKIALSSQDIAFIELDTRYFLAKALAVQGNKDCIKEAGTLSAYAHEYQNTDYILKSQIVITMYKCLQGLNVEVRVMLNEIKEALPRTSDRIKNIQDWQFISVLNNLMLKEYDNLQAEIAEAVNFNMNTGGYLYQPLLKAFSGKLLLEENNLDRANDLFHELINYASENKLAFSALTTWYFIAECESKASQVDKGLVVAEKALEITQNPAFNSIFFGILFKKQLAEFHLAKGEPDMAAMYLEQAIQTCQQQELFIWEARLSILYAEIFKIKAISEPNTKTESAKKAYKLYLNALDILKKVSNKKLVEQIEIKIGEMSEFCAKEDISV